MPTSTLDTDVATNVEESDHQAHRAQRLNDCGRSVKRRRVEVDEENRRKKDVSEENLEAETEPKLPTFPTSENFDENPRDTQLKRKAA